MQALESEDPHLPGGEGEGCWSVSGKLNQLTARASDLCNAHLRGWRAPGNHLMGGQICPTPKKVSWWSGRKQMMHLGVTKVPQVTPVTPLLLYIYLSSTKSHIDEELSCPFNKQQMTPKE